MSTGCASSPSTISALGRSKSIEPAALRRASSALGDLPQPAQLLAQLGAPGARGRAALHHAGRLVVDQPRAAADHGGREPSQGSRRPTARPRARPPAPAGRPRAAASTGRPRALGEHRDRAVREVDAVAAAQRLAVERRAGRHVVRDVRDRDPQPRRRPPGSGSTQTASSWSRAFAGSIVRKGCRADRGGRRDPARAGPARAARPAPARRPGRRPADGAARPARESRPRASRADPAPRRCGPRAAALRRGIRGRAVSASRRARAARSGPRRRPARRAARAGRSTPPRRRCRARASRSAIRPRRSRIPTQSSRRPSSTSRISPCRSAPSGWSSTRSPGAGVTGLRHLPDPPAVLLDAPARRPSRAGREDAFDEAVGAAQAVARAEPVEASLLDQLLQQAAQGVARAGGELERAQQRGDRERGARAPLERAQHALGLDAGLVPPPGARAAATPGRRARFVSVDAAGQPASSPERAAQSTPRGRLTRSQHAP